MSIFNFRLGIATVGAAVIVAAGMVAGPILTASAADPAPVAASKPSDHAAEALQYEKEAADLQSKATHHTELAKQYDARGTEGSKQATSLKSIAKHCRSLAKAYGEAAREAGEMAKLHRDLAASS